MRALKERGVSQRRACWLASCPRRTAAYQAKAKDDAALRARLEALAAQRIRWGYRRLQVLLRREGVVVNHKRLRRIHRAAGLQVRPRKRRHVRYVRGSSLAAATRLNQRWDVDFMHDALLSGRTIRAMNAIDAFSRFSLALEIDFSLCSAKVIAIFDAIAEERGYPQAIKIDNGPEFASLALLRWSVQRGVDLQFIDRGKPTQNARIESFNGRARDEFFNANCFATLAEARAAAATWRNDYNLIRPHSPLGYLTPQEFEDDYPTRLNPQFRVA